MVNFGLLAVEIVLGVVSVSQTLRRWTEGATYVRQGDRHVGHWPTFLVFSIVHGNNTATAEAKVVVPMYAFINMHEDSVLWQKLLWAGQTTIRMHERVLRNAHLLLGILIPWRELAHGYRVIIIMTLYPCASSRQGVTDVSCAIRIGKGPQN